MLYTMTSWNYYHYAKIRVFFILKFIRPFSGPFPRLKGKNMSCTFFNYPESDIRHIIEVHIFIVFVCVCVWYSHSRLAAQCRQHSVTATVASSLQTIYSNRKHMLCAETIKQGSRNYSLCLSSTQYALKRRYHADRRKHGTHNLEWNKRMDADDITTKMCVSVWSSPNEASNMLCDVHFQCTIVYVYKYLSRRRYASARNF